jgi:hypothetical protein
MIRKFGAAAKAAATSFLRQQKEQKTKEQRLARVDNAANYILVHWHIRFGLRHPYTESDWHNSSLACSCFTSIGLSTRKVYVSLVCKKTGTRLKAERRV